MKRDVVLILFLSMVMYASYHFTMAANWDAMLREHDYHQAIINGTVQSPYKYRILAPYTAEAIARVLPYQPRAAAELMAYSILHVIILPLSMLALYDYVRSVTNRVGGLAAAAFYFVVWPVILVGNYAWFAVYSPLELLLFCVALKNLHRPTPFTALMLVAILNRETGVLLAVIYFLTHWRSWRSYIILLTGILAVFALRMGLGEARHASMMLNSMRHLNTDYSRIIIFNLFFLPLWIAAYQGYKRASWQLRRIAWVAPLYGALLVWFANLNEVRLYLTLFPILLPLVDYENSTQDFDGFATQEHSGRC